MRRYWLDSQCVGENEVVLSDETFHHICVVCRQAEGSRFEVISQGKAFFVEIATLNKKSAIARILEVRDLPTLPLPRIHLALSLPKFQTVDKVLEKMVELGVFKVHLFTSDFSFVKSKNKDIKKKLSRWEKIIKGATQQSGRGEVMNLTESRELGVLLEEEFRPSGGFGLLAYEGEGGLPVGERLKEMPLDCEDIWIFVGSEGGFSQGDLELFKDYSLLPISLGDQVLRVETACVTLVGILKYGLGHFDKGTP